MRRTKAERSVANAQLPLVLAGARAEEIRQAEAQIGAASAEASGIEADMRAGEVDLQRFETLLDARARVDVARERERGARDRVRAAREDVARLMAGPRQEELDAARARIAAVDAQLAVLEKTHADAVVHTLVTGVVIQTLSDAGEMVAPRMPILVVTDLAHAWANLFVPEPFMLLLSLGQAVRLITDAGSTVPGTVTYVLPQAEFTPRNVQTADERSRLVYRVEVAVDNTAGVLKQGMPVDADLGRP